MQILFALIGPPMITLSTTSDTNTYFRTIPNTNKGAIKVFSKDAVLQTDLQGIWELPNGSSVADSLIQFELFTRALIGEYNFYVIRWNGSEVIAIEIEISASGKSLCL